MRTKIGFTLKEQVKYLQKLVLLDYNKIGKAPGYESWSAAQITVALADILRSSNPDIFMSYIFSSMDTICYCWNEESHHNNIGAHIGVTGWAVLGMSKVGDTIPHNVLDYLIDSQNDNGAWPLYPYANKDSKYSSSFATYMAMIALHSAKDLKGLSKMQLTEVNQTLDLGYQWLLLQKEELNGEIHWKDYPEHEQGKYLNGIIALAIHTMHTIDPKNEDVKNLYREWLKSVVNIDIPIHHIEKSELWYSLKNKNIILDKTTHYTFPSLLIAVVDAYKNGTDENKMAIDSWLNNNIEKLNIQNNPDVHHFPWFRAELLYSLCYFLEKIERK